VGFKKRCYFESDE